MKRREHFVTAIGDFQCCEDRVRVTQLADDNDVRILAKGLDRALFEREHIAPDFPVPYDAAIGLVHELDR